MRRQLASPQPDWQARARELEAENARLHEKLAAAARLNEILCDWARSLETRVAELASRGGRPRKVDHTEVVERIGALVASGLDLPSAKAKVEADLKAEGKCFGKRQIEKIMAKAPRPVRLIRTFRLP